LLRKNRGQLLVAKMGRRRVDDRSGSGRIGRGGCQMASRSRKAAVLVGGAEENEVGGHVVAE
jgi:hypothetical protein